MNNLTAMEVLEKMRQQQQTANDFCGIQREQQRNSIMAQAFYGINTGVAQQTIPPWFGMDYAAGTVEAQALGKRPSPAPTLDKPEAGDPSAKPDDGREPTDRERAGMARVLLAKNPTAPIAATPCTPCGLLRLAASSHQLGAAHQRVAG